MSTLFPLQVQSGLSFTQTGFQEVRLHMVFQFQVPFSFFWSILMIALENCCVILISWMWLPAIDGSREYLVQIANEFD